jgi:hypothetical protein
MTKEQKQGIADKMIDHLAERLDELWEDGGRYTTYDAFGQEVEFAIDEGMTAPIKAQVLSRAKEDVQLVLPLIREHCLTPDYLQQFADGHCQQARTLLQEKCDEVSNDIRNYIFEV